MKKITIAFITFGLFALSVYLTFRQGSVGTSASVAETALKPAAMAELVYDGFQAKFAGVFATVMNGLSQITGGQMIFAIILLALLVELVLLYPSVRIQLKQKKIHLYHKHLVDLYDEGKRSYHQTENEIHRLYDVNEKIHTRGALFVTAQMLVFLALFWGLNLMVKAPVLAGGSWSIFNISLLHKPTNILVPVLVSLLYFLHALVKIYCKEREDYIAPSQTFVAILFAILGSAVIYFFAGTFALALSVYFVTLITFSTIRYLATEERAQAWGQLAQKELFEMLEAAGPHRDRFEYISRKWNHFPVVRHLNFHLLEEALSMSLGLLLALNFFGVFEDGNAFGMNISFKVPRTYAIAPEFRECRLAPDVPNCSLVVPGYGFSPGDMNSWQIGQYYFIDVAAAIRGSVPPAQFIPSCCFDTDSNGSQEQVPFAREAGSCVTDTDDDTGLIFSYCYADGVLGPATPLDDVTMISPCPLEGVMTLGETWNFEARGGTGYYRWVVRDIAGGVEKTGDGTTGNPTFTFTPDEPKVYAVWAEDYFNELNSAETNAPSTSCAFEVRAPISLVPEDQPPLLFGRDPVQLRYHNGPPDPTQVEWQLMSGPGSLDIHTGMYTLSSDPDDLGASIEVRVKNLETDEMSNELTLSYINPACHSDFGIYDLHDRAVALKGQLPPTKRVYPNVTYRFFVKNAVVSVEAEVSDFATMGLDDEDREEMLTSFNQSISQEGTPYFDIRFAEDENYSGDDGGTLTVSDPHASEGAGVCQATLNFQHLGRGFKASTSKRVKMSIH